MTLAQGVLTAARWADLARRRGRPRHGEALRRRVHRHHGRLRPRSSSTRATRSCARRLDHDRRRHGRGDGGPDATLAPPTDAGAMAELLKWADERARLKVRANADTGPDAERARKLGAAGIGLCRTEHMFFQPEALKAMRQMILADDERSRSRALSLVLPLQREEFKEFFRAMDGLPVTIRLLDPPLHEFLPERSEDVTAVAKDLGVRTEILQERLRQLHEANPMMGHRGCGIGMTTPRCTRPRCARSSKRRAIRGGGRHVMPEVMIPLVSIPKELEKMRAPRRRDGGRGHGEEGSAPRLHVGTMIELPRAALLAEANRAPRRLLQLRHERPHADDVRVLARRHGQVLPCYLREGILQTRRSVFDIEGVGELAEIGTKRGRDRTRSSRSACAESTAATATGVAFFHKVGLDYVSCSPFRVPVARLAAAHAALGLHHRRGLIRERGSTFVGPSARRTSDRRIRPREAVAAAPNVRQSTAMGPHA